MGGLAGEGTGEEDGMSGRYVLDEEGNPREEDDLMTWASWLEKAPNRVVAQTETGNGKVSTVFLGLDHSFGGTVPILYETLVFGGTLDEQGDRYATRREAEAGHAEWVKKVGGK